MSETTGVAGAEQKMAEEAEKSFSTPAGQLLGGQVAVVTGGGTGIGLAICKALAREGALVAILDVNTDAAGEAVTALTRSGGAAAALPGRCQRFGDRPGGPAGGLEAARANGYLGKQRWHNA